MYGDFMKWFKSQKVEEIIFKKYSFKKRKVLKLLNVPLDEEFYDFSTVKNKKGNIIGFVIETRKVTLK